MRFVVAGVSVAVKQIMPDHVLARQEKRGPALHPLIRDKNKNGSYLFHLKIKL
jgi:hypothetical protein